MSEVSENQPYETRQYKNRDDRRLSVLIRWHQRHPHGTAAEQLLISFQKAAQYFVATHYSMYPAQAQRDRERDCVDKLVDRVQTYREQGCLRGWMFTLMRRSAINNNTTERKKQVWHPLNDYADDSTDQRASVHYADTTCPHALAERAERANAVREAIELLPYKLRVAVSRFYGLSDCARSDISQIANLMEIPIGTVKSLLTAARRKLEHSLRQFAPEGRKETQKKQPAATSFA